MHESWQTVRGLTSEPPSESIWLLVFIVTFRKIKREKDRKVGKREQGTSKVRISREKMAHTVKVRLLQAYVRIELHETC